MKDIATAVAITAHTDSPELLAATFDWSAHTVAHLGQLVAHNSAAAVAMSIAVLALAARTATPAALAAAVPAFV